jgi:hypothetical protein
MGAFWQFFSFEPKRWRSLFDGSSPDAKIYFVTSAWESTDPRLPDPERQRRKYLDFIWKVAPRGIVEVAEHLAKRGPTYVGLTQAQARILDHMLVGLFSAEGGEFILKYKVEHKDGLADSAVRELLSRSQPAKVGGVFGVGGRVSLGYPVQVAQWLVTGRRCGTNEAPNVEDRYFVFEPAETHDVLREVEGLISVDRPWQTPEFEGSVQQELAGTLRRAASKGLYLAGRYT